MKLKKNIIAVPLLFFLVLILGSCTRSQLEEPSPVGPSTISVVFKVSAKPNLLAAGASRQSSIITASLKKFDGTPFPGRTVFFEIRDSSGMKTTHAYDGFFPNDKHAITRTTDSQGIAEVKYYGPNARELLEYSTSREIYIYGFVAWEGMEFLVERTPVKIMLVD